MSQALSEHLPLIASAPDGIQKLRGLILELAVRGKLVPQNPNDEPASVLLMQIAKERTRREASGIYKKSKPLPSVSEDEKPFDLPNGWSWGRLSDVAAPQAGFAFKSAAFNDAGIGMPLIRIRDVGFSVPTTYFDGPYREEFVVNEGDYLVSMDGQFRVAVWRGQQALLNQRVSRLQFYLDSLAKSYFAISLHIRLADLQGIKAYTTVDHLSGGQIATAVVGIPPLAEQHRIVAKVDELMALCDRLESEQSDSAAAHTQLVETLLGTLTQSTDAADFEANWKRIAEHFDTLFTTKASIEALQKTILQMAISGKLVQQNLKDTHTAILFTETKSTTKFKHIAPLSAKDYPFKLPPSWSWVRFDSLISVEKPISYGVLVPGPDTPGGVPFVRLGDLSVNSPAVLPEKTIAPEIDAQYQRTRLEGGEILMGVVGSIGKLGVAPLSWKGANIARAVCRILPTTEINKDFLLLLLQSEFMQQSFKGNTKTLAQPTLNIGLIRLAPTPLPPLSEQIRIASKVDELMSLCDSLKKQLAESRNQEGRFADTLIQASLKAA